MKNISKLALSVTALLAITTTSQAIMYDASVDGLNNPVGTFTASGGALVVDTKDGVSFLGVAGSPQAPSAGTEIDVNQSIEINFDDMYRLESLTLGLLFNGPEYKDTWEIAVVTANALIMHTLTIDGENTATWSNGGVVVSTVPGSTTTTGGGGVFTIYNPFGNLGINSLLLAPQSNGNLLNDSDFGLVSFQVPDSSSTLALMGFALVAVGALARRRQARA